MAEVVSLAAARAEREQRAKDIEQQRLEAAARLVVQAAELVGLPALGGLCSALGRRLG